MGVTATWERVGCHTRWLCRSDLPEVLAIERASFDCPWTEAGFLGVLGCRSCIGIVAERGGRVVGYAVYRLYRRRFEILNLAVAPDVRRRGVGSALLLSLAAKLYGTPRQALGLNVGERNLPAQLFLRAVGFRAAGVLRRPREDRLRFTWVAPAGAA